MRLHGSTRKSLALRDIRHVALDMDGTIYRGKTLFATTAPFLSTLEELGIRYMLLTNNPSRSVSGHLQHLTELGLSITQDQLYTSTHATLEYLREQWPVSKKLFVLGTPGMCEEFRSAGFTLLPDDPEAEPDAVIVGFDTTLTYSRLCRAAWWISRNKPYFATNPDRICPTDQPTVLVDCGSLCAALEAATGRAPTAVLGKPDPAMIRGILHRHSLEPHQLAMVGDRLYTDIAMAHHVGAFGVLVLTGETSAEVAARHRPPPDLIVDDLAQLAAKLREAHREGVAA